MVHRNASHGATASHSKSASNNKNSSREADKQPTDKQPTDKQPTDKQPTAQSDKKELNTGEIIGIVFGSIVGLALLASTIIVLYKKFKK